MSRPTGIKVEITRSVDSGQPGFVELAFVDALDRLHRFTGKAPVVTTDAIDAASGHPRAGIIECTIVARGVDGAGGSIITVDTRPWSIESTTGESTFVVRPEQLDGIAEKQEQRESLVVFVDVDDTLVRSAGTKRMPIPHVVQHVRELSRRGAALYLWSRGGGDYARTTASEIGLADCFRAFLPKPNIILDDENVSSWRSLFEIHPSSCRGLTVDDYKKRLVGA